jgi:hypothetical protein
VLVEHEVESDLVVGCSGWLDAALAALEEESASVMVNF